MDTFMDDLFGDAPAVQLPRLPIIKSLSSRLNDLANSNACQKIAWSKIGVIASVAPDGKSVNTFVLIRNRKSATWELSSPLPLPVELGDSPNTIVHVSWSYFGADLAVIDSSGRIFIYTTPGVLGRLALTRAPTLKGDPDSELNGIVGMYWMHIAPYAQKLQKSSVLWVATKNGPNWSYNHEKVMHMPGPFNPIERQNALIGLTRMGTLRVLYQSAKGEWFEQSSELDGHITDLNLSITHASFAPSTEQIFFITTYDRSNTLRLFKAQLNWAVDGTHDSGLKLVVIVTPVDVIEFCLPELNITPDKDVSYPHNPPVVLTHLEILPQVQTIQMKRPLPASIIAIFAPVCPSSSEMMDPNNQYHTATSTVCRWFMKDSPETRLLPVFDSIQTSKDKPATSSIPAKKDVILERQPDHYMQAFVLSIELLNKETMFAFSLSDGSIEFRFRESLELATADGNNEEVHTLQQSGFAFSAQNTGLHLCLSPNTCCAASMQANGKVKIIKMEYILGDILTLKEDDPHFGCIAALMGVCCIFAWVSNSSTDDIMAIIPSKASDKFIQTVVESIWISARLQNASLALFDSTLYQQVYHNKFILKCLSIQRVLGSKENSHLTLNATLAWIALNLKMLSFNLAQSLQAPNGEIVRPEVFVTIQGIVKWALDMITYCLQDIFDIIQDLGDKIKDIEAVKEYINKTSTPCVHLLLGSMTRFFLRNTYNSLKKIYMNTVKLLQTDPRSSPVIRMREIFGMSPVTTLLNQKVSAFEDFHKEIDNAVRSCYRDLNRDQKEEIERQIFIAGSIPSQLNSVVTHSILANAISKFQNVLRPELLYRHDVTWLGLIKNFEPGSRDDLRLASSLGTYIVSNGTPVLVDVIRKWPLSSSATSGPLGGSGTSARKIKSCPRCRSVAEDHVDMSSMQQMGWLVQAMRQCVCTNMWCAHEEVNKVKKDKVKER